MAVKYRVLWLDQRIWYQCVQCDDYFEFLHALKDHMKSHDTEGAGDRRGS